MIKSLTDKESILLTGASGFIGRYLNEMLDYHCAIACRNFIPDARNTRTVLFYDLLDEEGINDNFKGIEVVIHMANLAHKNDYNLTQLKSVNVDNTLKLARIAAKRNVQRFVYVSSILVNGSPSSNSIFSSDSKALPNTPYAQSKYDAEKGLRIISAETGLEVVIVRPTLVYGPNAPGNFGTLIRLVEKVPFLPFGLSNNKRDFISIQNLASLLIACANHPAAEGHTFLATDGETVSIKEFTSAIAKGLDKTLIQLPVPISWMRFAGRLIGKSTMVEQLLGNLQVDASNAQEVLDWVPPYTMEQAMASLSENKK